MAPDLRCPEPLNPLFKRGRRITLRFEGRRVEAYEGETVAAALAASGVRILARSFKFHRARGLFCGRGSCGRCLMRVDGVPNVRVCTTSAQDGMVVESQHGYPSASRDLLSILDRFRGQLSGEFQYRHLTKPRLLQPLYLKILRSLSGIGKTPQPREGEPTPNRRVRREVDLAVVGGGPAGLSAAASAADVGLKVALVEEGRQLGGRLLYPPQTHTPQTPELIDAVGRAGVEVYTEAQALGFYEGGVVGVGLRGGFLKLKTRALIVASGGYEKPPALENADLPGVYSARAVAGLLSLYGVRPGRRALVWGASEEGLNAAYLMWKGEVEVVGVLAEGAGAEIPPGHAQWLEAAGIEFIPSATVAEIEGRKEVEGVVVVDSRGLRMRMRCDMVCVALGLQPSLELIHQAGCHISFNPSRGVFLPSHDRRMATSVGGVYVAGEASGAVGGVELMVSEGRVAGLAASQDLSRGGGEVSRLLEETMGELDRLHASVQPHQPLSSRGGGGGFLCPCLDLTEGDVSRAIHEGYRDIESLKRYTSVTMGVCQGKYCLTRLAAVLAREGGLGLEGVSMTTQRPPARPIPFEAFMGEEEGGG